MHCVLKKIKIYQIVQTCERRQMLYVARNATGDPPSLRISDAASQLDLEARRMDLHPCQAFGRDDITPQAFPRSVSAPSKQWQKNCMESVPEEMHDIQIAPSDERQQEYSEHLKIEEDNTNEVEKEQLHNQETDMNELDNMLTVPTSDSSTISPMFSFANEYLRVNHIATPPFFLLPPQHQGALS